MVENSGNSLAILWLGLGASMQGAQVRSLVRNLILQTVWRAEKEKNSIKQFKEIDIHCSSTNYFGVLSFYMYIVLSLNNWIICVYLCLMHYPFICAYFFKLYY